MTQDKSPPVITELLRSMAVCSGNFAILFGFIATLVTGNNIGAWFSVGIVGNTIVNKIIKMAAVELLPESVVRRPEVSRRGCRSFPQILEGTALEKERKRSLLHGMPSGHAQTAAFIATFWIMYVFATTRPGDVRRIVSIIVFGTLAGGTIISRTHIAENCHTPAQVLVGAVLGVGTGAWYFSQVSVI